TADPAHRREGVAPVLPPARPHRDPGLPGLPHAPGAPRGATGVAAVLPHGDGPPGPVAGHGRTTGRLTDRRSPSCALPRPGTGRTHLEDEALPPAPPHQGTGRRGAVPCLAAVAPRQRAATKGVRRRRHGAGWPG